MSDCMAAINKTSVRFVRHNYAYNTNEERNRVHVPQMSCSDYLLPFYLTATARYKIKELSEARDRDYR